MRLNSIIFIPDNYTFSGINFNDMKIAAFVKAKRKNLGLTQIILAEKAGVGLRFIRDLEQEKSTLRLDKVNQVLDLFGSKVGVIRKVQ